MGTVDSGVRVALLARVAVEPPDVLSTSLRDGAVGLGHEEANGEALHVDGIRIVAVACCDVACAIDTVPRLALLSTPRVAEHASNGFLGGVALGDEVAVGGRRLAAALRSAAAKSAMSNVYMYRF